MTNDYHRIEAAIRYIQQTSGSQPGLDEIAEHVGLSKYHFQRLFRRWAGVSPKRYLQFLTVEQAKGLLRDSLSVLDTTFETGLSSPGRLHDLFVSAEAMTPGQYKEQGAGLLIRYGIHETPFGVCLLAATERGICRLTFVDEQGAAGAVQEFADEWSNATLRHDQAATAPLVRQAFGASGAEESPLRLLLRGTNFQLKVWQALLRVPSGAAVSYGTLARAIGHSGSAQAVGGAVGANSIAFLIPCHRVLLSSGEFGEYRWGAVRKRAILTWEGAQPMADQGTIAAAGGQAGR